MNLYYYDNYYYWSFIGVQQFAASFQLSINEYTYFLDLKKKGSLCKMQTANVIVFVQVIITRGVYYLWISYNLIRQWILDKRWNFLWVGAIVLFIFTFHNILLCIVPYYQRMMKFFNYKKNQEKEKNQNQEKEYIELSEEKEYIESLEEKEPVLNEA